MFMVVFLILAGGLLYFLLTPPIELKQSSLPIQSKLPLFSFFKGLLHQKPLNGEAKSID